MTSLKNTLLFILINLVTTSNLLAQKVVEPRVKASPVSLASFMAEDNQTYLKVTYGSPRKKGREIFGGLVAYGEVWRTGANEATEFTTTRDIKINKKILKAGTYTLFTVPEKDSWTVIFNSTLGQWGAYKYEEHKSQNVLSFKVNPETSEDIYEAFTIQFEQRRKGVDMVIVWGQTQVAIPITFLKK